MDYINVIEFEGFKKLKENRNFMQDAVKQKIHRRDYV
jgi:hypothetical protein